MPRVRQLTHRQREILRLVAQGLGNREIAHELGCSPNTVSNHLGIVFAVLGVTNRIEALLALGWIAAPRKA